MRDIIEIYNDFLVKKDKLKKITRDVQAAGRFSASSAGLCAKKLWFQKNNYPYEPFKPDLLRLFRLGTIVGRDIEEAMFQYKEGHFERPDNVKVYSEKYIKDDDLGIGGSFDLLVVDDDRKGYLYDYKTCNSWKWRSMFGYKKSSNPSSNYEFQLGTYAMMLNKSKEFCDEIVEMSLIYYNKDNSMMKSKDVSLDYIEFAEKYWKKAIETANMVEQPINSKISPYYPNWECKTKKDGTSYCSYIDHCNSIYKNEVK